MRAYEKEIIEAQITSEKAVIRQLQTIYNKSISDINDKIAALQGRYKEEGLQSIIYQLDYQKALKKEIGGILDVLQSGEYEKISDYLSNCYQDGFIGTMYSLQKQGIPLIMPMDQEQVINAIVHQSKISKGLYTKLGADMQELKARISIEVSRGLSSNMSYEDIARNLENTTSIGINRAIRIARTEGHRIQAQAQLDACYKAKDKGADVVKQWDASLDSRTRPSHRKLDGQIRELDEPFEVDGKKAMCPGQFGKASEDVNCRCAILQRAKWGLDEEELETLKERAKFHKLDKTKDFEEYKEKYLKAIEEESKQYNVQDFIKDRQEFYNTTMNASYQKQFDTEYALYSKYQNGKANKDNFFNNSMAKFEQLKGRPKRSPDYVSYTRDGKISSEYWYEGDTLIRGSNHWGNGIASCDWAIDTHAVDGDLNFTNKIYGKVKFEDMVFKTEIVDMGNDQKALVGFDNLVEYKYKGQRVYKIDDKFYMKDGARTNYKFVEVIKDKEYGVWTPKPNVKEEVKKVVEEVSKEDITNKIIKEYEEKGITLYTNTTNKLPNLNDSYLNIGDNSISKIVEYKKVGNKVAIVREDGRQFVLKNLEWDNFKNAIENKANARTFVKAKTIEEAKEYVNKFADNVNLVKMNNLDSLNDLNEALEDLEEKYPTKKLKLIRQGNFTSTNMQANYEELDIGINYMNEKYKDSYLSPSDWKKKKGEILNKWKTQYLDNPSYNQKKVKKVIKETEEALKYDRWTVNYKGLEVRTTVAHEYGHILADQYLGQINRKHACINYMGDKERALRLKITQAFNKAKSNGDIYKISQYASQDNYEFFAETFSMYYIGKERLPDYIEEVIKEVLEHGRSQM